MRKILLFLFCLSCAFALTAGTGRADTLLALEQAQEARQSGGEAISPELEGRLRDSGALERLENDRGLQELLREGGLEERLRSGAGKAPRAQGPQEARLVLKVEPGDGVGRLTWHSVGYRQTPDQPELRFQIQVGTSSERPASSIDVGGGNSYTLRDLKNHQTYFVRVVALNRDRSTLIRSDEVKFTPLPAEEQGSSLEKAYARKSQTLHGRQDAEPFKRELRQFGYDFFKNSAQSGADASPVGEHYLLGPGDTLSITLWGAVNASHDLTVDRNGEITIPQVGAVKVWGLSYDKARGVVHRAVSRYFKNFEMNLTLGRLRSIQVYLVGEVELPGSYQVSSQATVLHALAAGGGPTKNGSLRAIRLTRKGSPPQEIDLYDMFLTGDRSGDLRLQDGDTLFVPVLGAVVAIAGEVKRPAIYEMKGTQTLADVVRMAGGVSASGYTGRMQIERFQGNSSRVVLDYRQEKGAESVPSGIEVKDRDMVKVFPVQEAVRQVVTLSGNVARPGDFQYRSGMRVTDVIAGFSDLLPESHLDSAEVTRLALPDYHKEILTFNLRKALSGSAEDNIPLQEQDSIRVFSRWEMQERPSVTINGFVVNPGVYDYHPGMTVRDLVAAAGSPKRNAELDTAELSRVRVIDKVASSQRLGINLGQALAGDPDHNMALQPDDVLIVRGITGWTDSTDKFVRLKGEVKFPGVYSVDKGEKLSSVITRAGGYTEKAYLRGAKFTRRAVREEQQRRMDEILVRTELEISQKQAALASVASSREELDATKAALEGLMKNIERMKKMKAEGRVVINLAALEELRDSSYDLDMEGGDTLEIPPRSNVINVLGMVYNPTAYVFLPEKSTVDYYLNKSGGATNEAETSEIYVVRADGTVFSRQQSSFGFKWSKDANKWSFGSFMSSFLEPGDSLVVPQKLERTAWLRDIKDITTIMSQIALTAGTVLIGLR